MPSGQLYQQVTVKLDGSGNGSVYIGPTITREYWNPTQASVSVATNTKEATCALWIGNGAQPAQLLQTTESGSTGDTYGFGGFQLRPGQTILAIWNGGDANATATLSILGERGRYGIS